MYRLCTYIFNIESALLYMLDDNAISRTFEQAWSIWINPEIERRRKKGLIGDSFLLKRAQIVLRINQKPKVKFNEEVEVIAEVKVNRDVIKGEAIMEKDVKSIGKIIVDCPDNCGHFTLINLMGKWTIIFDFRYNKKRIKEFIEASEEFFYSAKENLKSNRLRPFYENCWASAELSSTCHFLSLGGEYETHRKHLEKLERWSELGNVDKSHKNTLKKLDRLRKSSRYLRNNDFKKEDAQEILSVVKKMIESVKKLI